MTSYRGVRAATVVWLAVVALEGTAAAQLVINEIDSDNPGTDSAEFIEILNAGGSPVGLDGWSVELVNGGGTPAVYQTIPLPDVELAAGDYFVICGDAARTPACDQDVTPDGNLVQNGSPDAVVLRDASGVVDVVSYGGTTDGFSEGTGAVNDTDTDFLGLSRSPDGADSGDNATDVGRRCITPGAANAETGSSCPDPAAECGNGEVEAGEVCDDGEANGTTECGCTVECDYVAVSEPCGDQSVTECTAPDRCRDGVCSPNDAVEGQSCGDQNPGVCDQADICDGAGTCSPNPMPAGGPCGDPTDDDCTDADSCNEAGECMPNHEGEMVACGDPTDDACTDADTCDGFGACLPNDEPDGTPCDNGAFCDGDDVCVDASCAAGDSPCADGEVCDEATDQCARPDCGDGAVSEGEECDDGDEEDGDGCTGCAIDDGWVCGDEPPTDGTSDCAMTCGNGLLDRFESCDDDNLEGGDGCDPGCQIEAGWDCFDDEEGMVCAPMCGDGIVLAGEECDDGNLGREDGCSHCQVDLGWECDDGEPTECSQVGDDGGCSCRAAGDGGAFWLFLLLLIAGRLRCRARHGRGRGPR